MNLSISVINTHVLPWLYELYRRDNVPRLSGWLPKLLYILSSLLKSKFNSWVPNALRVTLMT